MVKLYAEIKCSRRNWHLRITTRSMLPTSLYIRYSTIHMAYDRPSNAKVSAYHDCCELADYLFGYFHAVERCYPSTVEGICSINRFMFTYGCDYYVDDTLVGKLYITPQNASLSICENYLQSFCDTFGVKI